MNDSQLHRLIDIAILMAQELQELIDDAIEASGNDTALQATQDLMEDWEAVYAACGLSEEDHFQPYRLTASAANHTASHVDVTAPPPLTSEKDHFRDTTQMIAQQATPLIAIPMPAEGIALLDQGSMRNLARCIQQMLLALTGKKLAFFINVFSDNPADLRGQYISNAHRHQVIPEIDRLLKHLQHSNDHQTLH